LQATIPDGRVLIVVREQRSMLLSLYQQYVKVGGVRRLKGYINDSAADRVRGGSFRCSASGCGSFINYPPSTVFFSLPVLPLDKCGPVVITVIFLPEGNHNQVIFSRIAENTLL